MKGLGGCWEVDTVRHSDCGPDGIPVMRMVMVLCQPSLCMENEPRSSGIDGGWGECSHWGQGSKPRPLT